LESVVEEARNLEVAATGSSKLEYGHHPDSLGCRKSWQQIDRDVLE